MMSLTGREKPKCRQYRPWEKVSRGGRGVKSNAGDSNSKSKLHLDEAFGSSTHCLYAFVASILAALVSSLI
jgi:hypothetical protein